jgi:hypothetical protein
VSLYIRLNFAKKKNVESLSSLAVCTLSVRCHIVIVVTTDCNQLL